MKKKSVLILLLLLVLVPSVVMASGTRYVKTSSGGNVRVRSGPGTDYDIIAHVNHGQKVETYEQVGSWTHVSASGHDGWMASRYLSTTKPKAVSGSTSSGSTGTNAADGTMFKNFQPANYYVKVVPATSGSFVNLRWAPSKAMPVQAKYYGEQVLYVLKQNSSWCQVYDQENRRIGFMVRSMLTYYDPATDGANQ